MEDEICKNGSAHVFVIPFTNQGHITPMVRLATQLCRKGVTITFASPEVSVAGLTNSADLDGLDFRFIALPKPEREPEEVRDGSTFMSNKLREAFVPVTERLLREKKAGNPGPTCIISDVFFPWTQVRPKYEVVQCSILHYPVPLRSSCKLILTQRAEEKACTLI
jgi:UDP:flavonoid glycosyltransferase YjiC (YdhE family)